MCENSTVFYKEIVECYEEDDGEEEKENTCCNYKWRVGNTCLRNIFAVT
jgi:hypothetical protein